MPARRLPKLLVLLVVASLTPLSVPGASADTTYTYDNRKYASPKDALKAQQRDLDAQAAAVSTSSAPVRGKALIVLPDRDRLRPLALSAFKIQGQLTTEATDYVVEFRRQVVWNVANAIIKGRVFTEARIVEQNDTVQPAFDGFDYVVWFQVKSIKPDFTGPWVAGWLVRKSGSPTQLQPRVDPGQPLVRQLAAFIETLRQDVALLDNPANTPAASAAPGGGAAGSLRRASSGTGIVIAGDGLVVTNDHVVQSCGETRIRDRDGNLGVATLKARDAQNDLALLKTSRRWQTAAQFRDGAGIRAGDGVVVVGFPLTGLLGSDANVTTGAVSALSGLGSDTRYLQLTAPVQPGNSGGPLLDLSGGLVGVVTAKLNAIAVAGATGDIPQNVNFAIKAAVVRNFLDANAVTYGTTPAKRTLSAADVGDLAKKFTVLIECWK